MKKLYPKIKLTNRDKKEMLIDVLTLQETAKKLWGNAIYFPDDYGMEVIAWQWHLGQIMTSRDPKKTLKKHLHEI